MVLLQDARTSNQEIFQGWSRTAGDENRGPGRSEDAPGQNRGAGRSDDDRGENRGPRRAEDGRGENRGPRRSEDDRGENRGPRRAEDDRGENRGPRRSEDDQGENRGPKRSEDDRGENRGPRRSEDDRGENRGPKRSEDDQGENRGPKRSEENRRAEDNRQPRQAEESERREPPGQARKNDEARRLELENRQRAEEARRQDGPGRSEDAPGQARKRDGSDERSSLMERIREAMRKDEARRPEPAEPRRDSPQPQNEPRRPTLAQPEPPRRPPVPAQPEPPRKQPAAELPRRPPDEPLKKSPIVLSAPIGQQVRKPETQTPAAPEPPTPTPTPHQPASRALYKRPDATPRLPEQSTVPAARALPQAPQESRLPTPQARLPELPRPPRGEQPITPAPTPAVRVDKPAPQRVDPAPSHATVVSRNSAEGAGTQSGGQQESEGRARPTEIARLSAPVVRENRLLSRFLLPGRGELDEELEALKNSPRVESIQKRNRGGGQGGGGGQQSSGQSSGQASGGPAAGEAGLEGVDPHTGMSRMLVRPGLQPVLPQLEQLFATAGLSYAADTEETPQFMRSYWIAMAWLSQHQGQHGLSERMCYFGAAMFEGMQGWRRKGQVSEEQVVNRLLAMLAEEGGFLGEHSLRVMTFADAVCEDLNVQDPAIREQVRSGALLRDLGMAGLDYRQLPPALSEQVQGLRNSGDLHMAGRLADIGALRVPAEIRNKPGPLNAEERALMEKHPEFGEQLLARFPAFRHLGPIVRAHHERWDGRGYPDGQMGRRIPMASRIIAVSDVFDALTSERPWREAWSYDRAIGYIQEGAGTQFDPEVVRAFLRTSRRLKAAGYLD